MNITFNDLPNAVSNIYRRLENIEALLQNRTSEKTPSPKNEIMTIQEVATYLRLSKPTIYGLVHRRAIPCMKKSKRLYFSKVQLDNWLLAGQKTTLEETATEVDNFLSKK